MKVDFTQNKYRDNNIRYTKNEENSIHPSQ